MLKRAYTQTGVYIAAIVFTMLAVANVFIVWKFAGPETTLHIESQSLITLFLVPVYVGIVWCAYKWIRLTNATLLRLLIGYIVLVCGFLIFALNSEPVGDIVDILPVAHTPEPSDFQPHGYLDRYPQQLGMLSLVWGLQNLFHQPLIVFKLLNLLLVVGMVIALYGISKLIFNNKNITKLTLIMMFFMFPVFFYVCFVYSDIIGVSLSIIALLFALLFSKKRHIKYAIAAGVIIAIAITLRQNSLIYLIAITLLYIVSFDRAYAKRIIFAWLIIPILVVTFSAGLRVFWETHLHVKTNSANATPSVAWVAMGMQDYNKFGLPSGWWNDYNNRCYNENITVDMKKCGEQSVESIQNSASHFIKDPSFAVRFYWEKMTSQWAEPTFQSVNLTANDRHSEREQTPLEVSLNDYNNTKGGISANAIVERLIDVSWIVTIVTALIWILYRGIKNRNPLILTPLFIIVGGFLFHMIWEAKSRYILAYYPLFVLYASAGAYVLFSYDYKKLLQKLHLSLRSKA